MKPIHTKYTRLVAHELRYGDGPAPVTEADTEILGAIESSVREGEGLVTLIPEASSTLLMAALVAALTLVDLELAQGTQSDRSALAVGDTVMYRGRRGMYLGLGTFERMEGAPMHRIQFKDGLVLGVPKSKEWEISRCARDVRRIDSSTRKTRVPDSDPRTRLRQILGKKRRQIPASLNSRLIVVAPRNFIVRHLSELKLRDTPCTTILPAGYFSRSDQFIRLGDDPLSRDPVICFSSRIDVALELARGSKASKALIVGGLSQLGGNIGELRSLRHAGISVIVAGEIHRMDNHLMDTFRKLDFRILASNIFCENPSQAGSVGHRPDHTNPFVAGYVRRRNVVEYEMKVHPTTHPAADHLKALRTRLREYYRDRSLREHLDGLLLAVSSIVNRLTYVPVPTEDLELIGVDYEPDLERVLQYLPGLYSSMPREIYDEMRDLIGDLRRCLDLHKRHHPKERLIMNLLEYSSDDVPVLVRTRFEKDILSRWLRRRGEEPRVVTLTELRKAALPLDECITLGFYGYHHVKLRYSGLIRRENAILYPYELNAFQSQESRFIRNLRALSGNSPEANSNVKAESEPEDTASDVELETVLRHFAGTESRTTRSGAVDAITVSFEEGYVAFLTLNHRCRCLNLDSESIEIKNPHELEAGDIVVFVKDSSGDVFDELVSLVKQSDPKIRAVSELASLWKVALSRYLEDREMTIPDLQNQLRLMGVDRDASTIRAWFDDDRIGPEDDAIRAIGRLTQDPDLNQKMDEVVGACGQMRALHITVGRYLAKSIVKSLVGETRTHRETVWDDLDVDLSKHAELVTVSRVYLAPVPVPAHKTNRLNENLLDLVI